MPENIEVLSTGLVTRLTQPINWYTGDILLDKDDLDLLCSGALPTHWFLVLVASVFCIRVFLDVKLLFRFVSLLFAEC